MKRKQVSEPTESFEERVKRFKKEGFPRKELLKKMGRFEK